MRTLGMLAAVFGLTLACHGAMVEEGTYELLLESSFDFENWKGEPEFKATAGLGYFMRPDVEVGGFVKYEDVEFDSLWGVGAFGEYNIDFGLVLLPYLGASVAYLDGDDYDDEYFLLTLSAGIKYFIARNVAVAASLNYELATEDVYQTDGNWVNQTEDMGGEYTDSDLNVRLGLRCFFGPF
ncbi:MAG: outer membrane beta-barrel protein [Kiritimatiellae bacterium]|nr:outer membrane beta-barrel protein [Kiritimatiellia bacterium]